MESCGLSVGSPAKRCLGGDLSVLAGDSIGGADIHQAGRWNPAG